MQKKLDLIDFSRGIAIFTIVLMHLTQGALTGIFNTIASFGGAGVHVFILCSGFGLYLSHLNHPHGYVEFLKKRLFKLYLPYAVAVTIYAIWQWYLCDFNGFQYKELSSHLFLYKMFDNELDISICYPFWFISTILQFYIVWPALLKLMRLKQGLFISLLISVAWWIIVGILGNEDYRPWGSCFLQYLWEFVLGMYLAKWYWSNGLTEEQLIKKVKFWHLAITAVIGVALTGVMGKIGGTLKLFNDIPSLMGYLSLLLILYKTNIRAINSFFKWSNKISYELYLVHSLVFSIGASTLYQRLPLVATMCICLFFAYLFAWGYSSILHAKK